MSEENENVLAKFIADVISLFLGGALFYWFQGLFQPVIHFSHIGYWQE